jgi:hypothetical protein
LCKIFSSNIKVLILFTICKWSFIFSKFQIHAQFNILCWIRCAFDQLLYDFIIQMYLCLSIWLFNFMFTFRLFFIVCSAEKDLTEFYFQKMKWNCIFSLLLKDNPDYHDLQGLLNVIAGAPFKGISYAFKNYDISQTSSLSELQANKVLETENYQSVISFTARYLTKVFPAFYRQDSSNLNPLDYWMYGFQIGLNLFKKKLFRISLF